MFFEEILDFLKRFVKSRATHLVIVIILLFTILIRRFFILQIVNGDSYTTDFTAKNIKAYSISGAKGDIYDRNGELLAYNELAYTVKICDSGVYDNNAQKNIILNDIIYRTIHIIEDNNDIVDVDFPIGVSAEGNYEFTVDTSEKLRFFRDIFGKKSVSELSEKERMYTADEVMEYLIDRFEVDEKYSKEDTVRIVYFRNLMKQNSYQRYLEFTVAKEVSDETVAAILENTATLTGVKVSEDYIRKYVDSVYFAHIIGYTGRVSADELVELLEKDDQYEANDIVGKSGIEKAMETYLTGRKGERKVYIDNVGRVTEVISETEATRGSDVYLSIDSKLQKDIYDEVERQLSALILSKIITSEDKYHYNSAGDIDDVYIPISDVYFSMIDNSVLSLKTIAEGETDTQANVYGKFSEKQDVVLKELWAELNDTATPLNQLSEEMRVYEYYVYQYLLNYGIITRSDLDTEDSVYLAWYNEEISLKEFLTYALSKNWVNMYNLADSEYQSLYEAYDSLLKYVFSELPDDDGFGKKIYKYLIKGGRISGREVCAMLYEQGVLEYDEDQYIRVKNGIISSYDFITNKISNLEITPAQMALKPCSASVVVTSPKTGEILALVSYPSYDNNMLSGTVDAAYYNKLRNDNSLPLINRATASQCAPGSTFKIATTIAGVGENVLTLGEDIYCSGTFDKVTPSPRCWALYGHGTLDTIGAIRASCNCYFYEVGYRLSIDANGKFSNELGTSRLQKYTDLLGLSTKSGIEIYEATPHASNINSIASAIGQGNHNYAPINLARYVTTIASSGTCYDFTLINKIVDNEGNVLYSYTPKIANQCDFVSDALWNSIHTGMKQVLEGNAYFRGLGFDVAGKTGTAQENLKEPNHALLITYGPYEDPEIAVATVIQNGYISSNAAMLTGEVYRIYFEKERSDTLNVTGGNQVID